MSLRLLVGFALALIVGYLSAGALLPLAVRTRLLRLSIGTGLGLAMTAGIFFLWSLGLQGPRLLVADLFSSAVVIVALARLPGNRRGHKARATDKAARESAGWLDEQPAARLLVAAFAIALISSMAALIVLCRIDPHGGGWDAWAMWGMHARFMLTGSGWPQELARIGYWSHPEYPALLPAAIARLWVYARGPSLLAPAVVALSFALATVGLLVGTLRACRGSSAALIAGVLLLGTPFFIRQSASEYADVPLGFFYLLSLGALALGKLFFTTETQSTQSRQRRTESANAFADPDTDGRDVLRTRGPSSGARLIYLAGVAAGFAAWLKNEGLLWLVALLVSQLLAGRRSGGAGRRLASIVLGAAAPLFLLVVYRFVVRVPEPLLAQSPHAIALKIVDGSRYITIADGLMKYIPRTLPTLGLLIIYLIARMFVASRRVLGASATSASRVNSAVPTASWWCIGLTFAGYLGVYLITPFDLHWHLDMSLDRLLIQLWPAVLLASFLSLPSSS